MAKFPIKMAVKQDGKTHLVGTELEFDEGEIASLVKSGVIDADIPSGDESDEGSDFDLKQTISDLIAAGNDIKSMNMADIGKLLGANARGVKRKDVDAALTEIENETQSN